MQRERATRASRCVGRLALIYVLSGVVSALAAVIYVAHLGLAKSDLGTGYELQAIAAVVLGGTSVFGGRGTLFGSLLGLFFLSVLANGMHLMALPSELTGCADRRVVAGDCQCGPAALAPRAKPQPHRGAQGQLASNDGLVRWCSVLAWPRVLRDLQTAHGGHKQLTIAVMPKAKGDPYFISARAGAEEAAKELGVNLIWDGPTSLDASQQNELVENWITRGVERHRGRGGEQGQHLHRAAQGAGAWHQVYSRGMPMPRPNARDYFLNQATPEGIAEALADEAARLLPKGGDYRHRDRRAVGREPE